MRGTFVPAILSRMLSGRAEAFASSSASRVKATFEAVGFEGGGILPYSGYVGAELTDGDCGGISAEIEDVRDCETPEGLW